MSVIVADTSPLLHLARVGRLDLVEAVLGRVIVPRTVWSELVRPGTRRDVLDALRGATWLSVADDPALESLGLDPGETAAILLAGAVAAEVLLIDERRGRAVAVVRGLHVIGTLGVLVGARRAGALDRVAPVIAELRADGFWLSDAVTDAVLEQVGERG